MKLLALFLFVVVLVGCKGTDEYKSSATNATPQEKWTALDAENYDYEVQRTCFCTAEYIREMRVSVRNGAVSSAVYTDDGVEVSTEVLESLRTIDQWFAYIKKGLDKPFAKLEVEYHSEQGYPILIEADIRERVADDEQSLVLKSLVLKN